MNRTARGCFFASTFVCVIGLLIVSASFFLLLHQALQEVSENESPMTTSSDSSVITTTISPTTSSAVERNKSLNISFRYSKRWILVICMYLAFGICLTIFGGCFLCFSVLGSRRFRGGSVSSSDLSDDRKHVWGEAIDS